MDDRVLIEYICGSADEQTSSLVEGWIMQSEENMRHFAKVKDAYIYSTMPNIPANDSQMKMAKQIVIQQKRRSNKTRLHYFTLATAAVLALALITNAFIMLFGPSGPDRNGILGRSGGIEEQPLPFNRIAMAEYPQEYTQTIYTNKGTKGEVILPDSSVVKLNSDSKIVFPNKFHGSTREVFVTGEAFFKVKSNPDTPMVVNTSKGLMVKVRGTEFNLRAYENESITRTTLYSGKVDILAKRAEGEHVVLAELKPNESYVTRAKEKPLKVLAADTIKISAWCKGLLVFDNTPMDMVIKELERWHGAHITVKNDKVYKYDFTAKFKQESLVQVLESIKFCTGINYTIEGNNVVFY